MVKKSPRNPSGESPQRSHPHNAETLKRQGSIHTSPLFSLNAHVDLRKSKLIRLQTTKKKSKRQMSRNLPSFDQSMEQSTPKPKFSLAKESRSNQAPPDNKAARQVGPQMSFQPNLTLKKEGKSGTIDEEFTLQYYTGRTSYKLDVFNSITIRQGQIYNLLEHPFLKQKLKKEIKCNCSQSRCKAKYCICYSKGKRCGQDCGCTNCANTNDPVRPPDELDPLKSCRCQKSHCLKGYCECKRDGEFCNPSCKCVNCMNNKPTKADEMEEEILIRQNVGNFLKSDI